MAEVSFSCCLTALLDYCQISKKQTFLMLALCFTPWLKFRGVYDGAFNNYEDSNSPNRECRRLIGGNSSGVLARLVGNLCWSSPGPSNRVCTIDVPKAAGFILGTRIVTEVGR
jgi:hypothetical protein